MFPQFIAFVAVAASSAMAAAVTTREVETLTPSKTFRSQAELDLYLSEGNVTHLHARSDGGYPYPVFWGEPGPLPYATYCAFHAVSNLSRPSHLPHSVQRTRL
jgi:hypothetical protein